MPSRSRPDRHADRSAAGAGSAGSRGAGSAAGSGGAPQDRADDVRRFAELVRAQQAKERARVSDERRRADEARRAADTAAAEARRLTGATEAKERAARRLKDVRARGSNAAVADAEADYKQALADLLAIEHGERPSWAPAPPEPAPEAGATPAGDTPAVDG